MEHDSQEIKNIPQLFYPTEDLKMKKPNDGLAKVFNRRASDRSFSNYKIKKNQLSSLFYAFAQKGDMTRVLPSAGGKYPIEVFAFMFNAEGKVNKKVVYYNADNHSLSIVGNSPKWKEIRNDCGLWVDGEPSILFVFVGFPERVIDKYGERGGRFFLIEVGHYAQNLGLRIAKEKMKGVEAGGLYDESIKKLLKLEDTGAMIGLGFACGR